MRTGRCGPRSLWRAAPRRPRTSSPSRWRNRPARTGTSVRGRTRSVAVPVLGIIGPGRAGVGLALALAAKGFDVRLHGRSKKPVPKPLALTVGPETEPPAWIAIAGMLKLAVRDQLSSSLGAVLSLSCSV